MASRVGLLAEKAGPSAALGKTTFGALALLASWAEAQLLHIQHLEAGRSKDRPLQELTGEGDYLVGLGYVGGDAFGEVGVEFVGVFFCEEVGDGFFGFVEGGAFGVDGCGAVH